MAGIKGILFDKDGTLVDFNATWFAVADLMGMAQAETSPISADEPSAGVVVGRAYDPEECLPEKGRWQALGLLFVVRTGAASGAWSGPTRRWR